MSLKAADIPGIGLFSRYAQISPTSIFIAAMSKLSQIAFEAERLVGRMQETRRLALQQELVDLCEARWLALRGPQPTTPLAYALWSITPPLADLFADLHTSGDAQLEKVLGGHRPAWGLALLALAEIARGNAEGARLAHEPMMAFESAAAGALLAGRMAAFLRGELTWPASHKHPQQPPLRTALAVIAIRTGRCDLEAVLEVIRLLAASKDSADAALEQLREALGAAGVSFLAVEDGQVRFARHGHEHKPATTGQIAEMLIDIRQKRIG